MDEKEETILTGYPNVITYECSKKIIEQMESSIGKIKIGKTQGTCFFSKIPFPDKNNMLPVFITSNHIIKNELLYRNDQQITFKIKQCKNFRTLNLNNRMKYTNEIYDIAIIEIKEEDEIKNYLELDDIIIDDILNNDNSNVEYIDKTIYIIQYPKGELSVSYGVLNKIPDDKNHDFIHQCSTEEGSSGSPILNLKNKIVGVHKLGSYKKYNKGTFLNYPIYEFIKSNYKINISHNGKNEVSLINYSNFINVPYGSQYLQNLAGIYNINNQNIIQNQNMDINPKNIAMKNQNDRLNVNAYNINCSQRITNSQIINKDINASNEHYFVIKNIPNIEHMQNEIMNQSNNLPSYEQNINLIDNIPKSVFNKNFQKQNSSIKKISPKNSGNFGACTPKSPPLIIKSNEEKITNYIKSDFSFKENEKKNHKIGKGFKLYEQISKSGLNENGSEKTNQDATLVHINVGNIQGFNLFGILDGNGPHGHFVSKFCKEYFITTMDEYANQCKKEGIDTPEGIYNVLKKSNFKFIIETFRIADLEMVKHNTEFDHDFSGTTCNLVFQFDKNLICFNVGDSRAILIYDSDGSNNNQGIFNLSHDHLPDLPQELERILKSGGIVEKLIDQFGNKVGPYRIFKKGLTYPGLNISRSLGDFHAKDCGVITRPDIIEFKLSKRSKYMVICSHGVWKFLSNEDIKKLGNPFYLKGELGSFCKALVENASQCWESRDIIRDDISVVCIYFC